MRVNNNLVTWSSTYSVGVKVIDDQHKGLLNLVNDMYNHVTGNEEEERAYFQNVIRQAVNYVKIHFATEEKIMKTTKFQGYHEHKRSHDSFILSVVDIIRDFEAGKRVTLASFVHFLKDWILTHIAIMDKQYFDYLIKIATRKTDGKLSITAEDIVA
jgi:hemerythrin